MREILFKGFHECKEGAQKAYYGGAWHNGEWIRGNLIIYPDVNRAYIAAQEYKPAWGAKEVIRQTVGQYTGLTDKNGTEIFEGDILRFHNDYEGAFSKVFHCAVEYLDGAFICRYVGDDEEHKHFDDAHYGHFDSWNAPIVWWEVIGNIHNASEKGGLTWID